MNTSLNNVILAVLVIKEKADSVRGGAPIFIMENLQELEEQSVLLSRTTMSMVHELSPGIKILVKH